MLGAYGLNGSIVLDDDGRVAITSHSALEPSSPGLVTIATAAAVTCLLDPGGGWRNGALRVRVATERGPIDRRIVFSAAAATEFRRIVEQIGHAG